MDATKAKCVEDTGRMLVDNNQDIVKYLCSLQEEKDTLDHIIHKQYQERRRIEAEIEKLTYKLCLINKSLSMRIKSKNNYDKTIDEIKSHYERLVISSTTLRKKVENRHQELDDIMNKKIGTGTGGPCGEEIKMLYIKPSERGQDDCPCAYNMIEPPTKDHPAHGSPSKPGQGGTSFIHQEDSLGNSKLQSPPEKDPRNASSKNLNNQIKSNKSVDKQCESNNNNPNNQSRSNNPVNNPSNTNELIHNFSTNNPGNNSLLKNLMEIPSETNDDSLLASSHNSNRLAVASRSNNPASRSATVHHSEDEIEMASVTPDKEDLERISSPFKAEDLSLEGFDQLDDPLPAVRRGSKENATTNILLSRIKSSISKMNEGPSLKARTQSVLLTRRLSSDPDDIPALHSKESSYHDTETKMKKKSVSDVLNSTLGM